MDLIDTLANECTSAGVAWKRKDGQNGFTCHTWEREYIYGGGSSVCTVWMYDLPAGRVESMQRHNWVGKERVVIESCVGC